LVGRGSWDGTGPGTDLIMERNASREATTAIHPSIPLTFNLQSFSQMPSNPNCALPPQTLLVHTVAPNQTNMNRSAIEGKLCLIDRSWLTSSRSNQAIHTFEPPLSFISNTKARNVGTIEARVAGFRRVSNTRNHGPRMHFTN
jgi:hypothetical protein